MMPMICTEQAPVPPPSYHRAQVQACRLTDKFAKKGSYASEGENGDFMCQSCRCKQAMIYLTHLVRGSIIIL